MSHAIRMAVAGAVSGMVATLAMDLLWYRRYRNAGGAQPFVAWETSEGTEGYDNAAAPARTAAAIADLVNVELPGSSARTVNNIVHWATGVGWGKAHGVTAAIVGTANPLMGLGTGVVAWATSYMVLPRLGVYQPIGEYDTEELWQDLSAHLVYGTILGVSFRLLTNGSR